MSRAGCGETCAEGSYLISPVCRFLGVNTTVRAIEGILSKCVGTTVPRPDQGPLAVPSGVRPDAKGRWFSLELPATSWGKIRIMTGNLPGLKDFTEQSRLPSPWYVVTGAPRGDHPSFRGTRSETHDQSQSCDSLAPRQG